MTKHKKSKLIVVFDTNVLYTQVASDLVRNNIHQLIKRNSEHTDLTIEWYLPKVVIGERKHQMLGKAIELLSPLEKMEKLLGHSFGIGKDSLEMYVDKAIEKSIKDCGFLVHDLEIDKVDWKSIIERSISRRPPFEQSEKEKGFRDSLIANSFLQLVDLSPSTAAICRLAFVSEDTRLREYVEENTAGSKNVRVLTNIDELESLINTLVSSVSEEIVAELAEKAQSLFFEKENEKTLYYKEKIRDRIRDSFGDELKYSYIEGSKKETKTWWIVPPVFLKKEKARVHWVTTVEPEFELFHYEKEQTQNSTQASLDDALRDIGKPSLGNLMIRNRLLSEFQQKKVIDATGRDRFEVHWSANLSPAKNLTHPKVEKITYVGYEASDK